MIVTIININVNFIVAFLFAGMYFAVREAKLANPETYYLRLSPKLILGVFFVFIIFGWGYIG
jgi:hypothetical protein